MKYDIPDSNVKYIGNARDLYSQRNDIAYLYGAKGQRCAEAVFESLWAAEPTYFKKYSAPQKAEIKNFCIGKRVMDCSGFINECVNKLEPIKKLQKEGQYLQVDGGINADTAKICTQKGVNSLVAGSYVFNSDNIKERIDSLR